MTRYHISLFPLTPASVESPTRLDRGGASPVQRSTRPRETSVADDKRKTPASSPAKGPKRETETTTPEESAGPPRPFDVKTVEFLVRLMRDNELTEIDLREGDQRVRLCKGHAPAAYAMPAYAPAALGHAAAPVGATPAAPPTASAPATPAKNLIEIKSELIGTFYAKPKPDKDDYVKVGSRITPETVVCQIEAMKIFNEVKAGVSGVITEVCVKNGEPVEYNKVLFRVDPS